MIHGKLETNGISYRYSAEPMYAERIQYVVVNGSANARLIDLVLDPMQFIRSNAYQLHAMYYITKQMIPALDRIFSLIGVDVNSWFTQMPKINIIGGWRNMKHFDGIDSKKPVMKTIDAYYTSTKCTVCEKNQCQDVSRQMCTDCLSDMQQTSVIIHTRERSVQRQMHAIQIVCMHCCGTFPDSRLVPCISLDCPITSQKFRLQQQIDNIRNISSLFMQNFKDLEW